MKVPKYIVLLLSALLLATLTNIGMFGQPYLFAFFAFIIVTACFIPVIFIANRSSLSDSFRFMDSKPTLMLFLICCYYFLQAFSSTELLINQEHYYLFALLLLLFSLPLLFFKYKDMFRIVCIVIVSLASLEALYCVCQYFGIARSMDSFFKVTGSWQNPNVTAMFLAMTFPAFAFLLKRYPAHKIVLWLIIVLTVVVLVVLKGRTAFIGVFSMSFLLVVTNRQVIHKIKNVSVGIKTISIIVFLSIILLGAYKLYTVKQASSEGRMFVFKTSIDGIKNKPVFGSGLGMFEHDYNLVQASYFQGGQATERELENASFVRISYNEFLASFFEGGIIGFLLFLGFIVSVLAIAIATIRRYLHENSEVSTSSSDREEKLLCAYAVIAFCCMSLVNFTINAIPAMVLFIVYVGRCSSMNSDIAVPNKGRTSALASKKGSGYLVVLSCIGSLSLLFIQVAKAKAYSNAAKANSISKSGYFREAVTAYKENEGAMNSYAIYWGDYAYSLYRLGHYRPALKNYGTALKLSSNPDYYSGMGDCYYKLNSLDSAIGAYTTAYYIQPNRVTPQAKLMYAYMAKKDTSNAVLIANRIISMKPKVEGDKVKYYRSEAEKLITAIKK